jgi:hypothetical protein
MKLEEKNILNEALPEISEEKLATVVGGVDQVGPFDISALSTGEKVGIGGAVTLAGATVVGAVGRGIYKAAKFLKK